ncbi:Het-C-domain-containing protein [Sanghuangporus baumii]|uniref:Het-C-domain-containing protein n=1 Tax=Sanghuangporus baumii TaxID=108892 RepID=A0A9Q5N9J2_SANBA|nr:Het-C-domain-containing protein [Sanghuangporus baumii]
MSRLSIFFLSVLILLAILPTGTYAFGAGSIPNFSYLNDRAFRHGDIAEVLTTIAKSPHHHAGGSGGIADFFLTLLTKGILAVLRGNAAQTFTKSDMRRIYFGNWLRDYSQAMDVAGLSKMSHDTLILIIRVLGGYADDAQKYDPRLRPPVDPQELEVDPTNGMKKYMATEGHTWDTSTAHIRRTLRTCITLGRGVHGKSKREIKPESDKKDDPEDDEERWEAFRLLGSALHTLEDLFAHSNWCEIALRKLGCSEVYCHVGDEVLIRTSAGMAPPLVTGTFGSADFIHSVLGEASDHLSQASIVDLTVHMEEAESGTSFSSLRELLARLPEALGQKAAASQDLEKRSKTHRPMVEEKADDESKIDLTEYIPSEETQEFIWDVLSWRDDLVRTMSSAIESIPGLSDLLDELMDAINESKEVTLALKEQSQAVINMEQQYEVFDNPKASDPTHSILAKDHVDLILNEPAGRVAKIVVEHTVGLVVSAWYDDEQDIDHVINEVLATFYHPYFKSEKSKIQNQMINAMQTWLDEFQGEDRDSLLLSLTKVSNDQFATASLTSAHKQSVRDGKNRRIPSRPDSVNDSMSSLTASSYGYDHDSNYDDRRSVSEGEESIENEAPIEHEREAAEEHIIGLRRDYAAVLRNPNTSESAKRHAFEMLRTLRNAEGPREAVSSRTRIDEIEGSGSNPRDRFREPRVRPGRRLVRRKPAYVSDDDLSSLSSGFEFKF